MKKSKKIRKWLSELSHISLLHYAKLVFRSALFFLVLFLYITGEKYIKNLQANFILLTVIWVVFVVEMIFRFFPSSLESMGCQKQFAKNYIGFKDEIDAKYKATLRAESTKVTLAIAAVWILLNSGIGLLYFRYIIDKGILFLISLAFSVCDMICILFFCPFQTWFMKNKCCTSCRIYNWDYAMMFTPLIFIKSTYTWSILFFAIALLIRWEVTFFNHPERFFEETNEALYCKNCKEKLCHHKKQLRKLYRKYGYILKE